jgi:hypothetical protein
LTFSGHLGTRRNGQLYADVLAGIREVKHVCSLRVSG